MSINVIVVGSLGRMGQTLSRLVKEDPSMSLYAQIERKERIDDLSGEKGVIKSSDLDAVLAEYSKNFKDSRPVIIDFTAPEASLASAEIAAKHGAAIVIGTTGLDDAQKNKLSALAKKTPIFWSPNMSVGINALLKILPELTRILGDEYDVEMVELHHKHKKDSPSGTAIRLAEELAKAKGWSLKESACYHREGIIGERPQKQIGMQTIRGGDVVGVHTVYFMGGGERIEITHQAHSRDNFGQGALRAAKWLSVAKPGSLYSMQDLI